MEWTRLEREFYLRDAEAVARDLVGKYLVRQLGNERMVAEITEAEAYLGIGDRASHSHTGIPTNRTRVQWEAGGRAYVYLIYGMYSMFNVVTGPQGTPGCVLIREGRPVAGLESFACHRYQMSLEALKPAHLRNLLNGPGKFCTGFGLTREHNGLDLCGAELYLAQAHAGEPFSIGAGPRINIDYAGADAGLPLRFYKVEAAPGLGEKGRPVKNGK